jgi:tetratricopeptide (TPR) repeat protein
MGLAGEACIQLPPLAADAAAALFAARSSAHGVSTSPEDPDLAALIVALDGMPLAIEMAAARTGLMRPAEIQAQLGERLSMLRRADPDAEGETQTMRDVVQWSWSLLDDEERSALMQLSVFRGGFSRTAAEAVVQLDTDRWGVMDALEALRDHSMVWAMDSTSTTPRFRLPADVRAITLEHVQADGSMTPVATRHAGWFLRHSAELSPGLHGPRCGTVLAELSAELDNGLMVARQTHIQDHALAADATLALARVLTRTGPMSLLAELVAPMLEQAGTLPPMVQARLLDLQAFIQTMEGKLKAAETAARAGLTAAQAQSDPATHAQVLIRLASVLLELGQTQESMERFEAAETYAAEARDAPLEARALYAQGFILSRQGRFQDARQRLERGLGVARDGDAQIMEGLILGSLGGIMVRMRSLKTAEDCFKQTLAIFHSQGERRRETTVLVDLIILYTHQRRYEDGLSAAKQALAVARSVGNQLSFGHVLVNSCELHRVFGHLDLALADGEEALAICERKGSSSRAIVQCSLGMIRHEQGERQEALYHYRRALPVLEETGDLLMAAMTQANVGLCLHESGRLEAAATAYADAVRTLSEAGTTWEGAIISARRAALWAELGRTKDAAELLQTARQLLSDLGVDSARPALALYAGFVDPEGLKTWAEDHPDAAAASDETRLALRLLAARLQWSPE